MLVTHQDVFLKKLKVAVSRTIDTEFLQDYHVDAHVDDFASYMVARLSAYVWAGDSKSITVKVPDGWFQQWKLEKAPAWLRKKFPVKYKDMVIDVEPYFPSLRRIAEEHDTELRYRLHGPLKFQLDL